MANASYHTTVKELVSHGLLPEKYLKLIPRTNISRWKKDDYKRFVGSEINEIADQHTELIQIRANAPNRIWHTDITVVKALNNKKYYVYFVIDNFSRKILSYAVRETVSGLVTKGVLEEAYQKANSITNNLNVTLIVDGGPENNNIVIDHFISQSEINIQKLVALRDINYSNSMIERVNRVFKYRYLFPKNPRDLKHLKRILRHFIDDYNNRRPHGQLEGLTPDQAWIGLKPFKKERMKILTEARENRLAYNRGNKCIKCLK